jgi:hypothetical protein
MNLLDEMTQLIKCYIWSLTRRKESSRFRPVDYKVLEQFCSSSFVCGTVGGRSKCDGRAERARGSKTTQRLSSTAWHGTVCGQARRMLQAPYPCCRAGAKLSDEVYSLPVENLACTKQTTPVQGALFFLN